MELVACLSTGKGTWGHVSRLINDGEWSKIILVTNNFGKENFTNEKKTEMIVIDDRGPLESIRDSLVKELKEKLEGPEVAVNFASGSGKEHMALMSALLKCGLSLRFYALTTDGMKEI